MRSTRSLQRTVNSPYCGHCRDLELVSSLARGRKSGNFFQSNICNLFLIGTCLTLPNLGFLWVFFKYPKISKNGNPLFFLWDLAAVRYRGVSARRVLNYRDLKDTKKGL